MMATAPMVASDRFNCGSRGQMPRDIRELMGLEDEWLVKPDGTRTCSFCGSLHPADMIEIMHEFSRGMEGFQFSTSDKPHKYYAKRPGVQNASEGGIKFYGWHLREDDAEFRAVEHMALARYQLRMDQDGGDA